MITPRSAKEFAKLLGNDTELRKDIHYLIARVDHQVEKDLLAAVRDSLRRNRVSLQLLDHTDATLGLKRYYADIKAAGKFLKLW